MDTNGNSGGLFERYLTPIAIVLGAVIIALAFAFGQGAIKNPSAANPDTTGGTADISKVKVEGEPFVGDANAPVTMAFYFDYQCPFCKQFDQAVTTQLYENFVKTGKLKIVFKDFQFLGEDSTTAALFGRAMWELYPEQFYTWHQAMFTAQDDEGDQGFGDLPSIQTLTKAVPGVDVDKVTALMNQKRDAYLVLIKADRDEGASMGINGTPAAIVGTKLLSNLYPNDFYNAVAAEVNAGGK
ncbi:MAG: thioredoxin domain-containing protein [Minisyncoccia bacterium]